MIAPSRIRAAVSLALPATVMLAACGGSSHHGSTAGSANPATGSSASGAPRAAPGALVVRSSALGPDGRIQARFTCDGANVSPPLQRSAPPPSTREVAVTMIDLDAPGAPFVHWALAGLGPGVRALASGAAPATSVPGANSFGTVGYRGPCPPPGGRPHRYRIEVGALGQDLTLRRGFRLADVRGMLTPRVIARGFLQGTYSR